MGLVRDAGFEALDRRTMMGGSVQLLTGTRTREATT
jgi:hypothetical protein